MLNYGLPFGKSATGYKKALIGGWQFNAIDVWETGFPFSATNSVTVSGTGGGGERPNQLHNPNNIDHSISKWFDTSCLSGPSSRNNRISQQKHDLWTALPAFRCFHLQGLRFDRAG